MYNSRDYSDVGYQKESWDDQLPKAVRRSQMNLFATYLPYKLQTQSIFNVWL